MRDELDARIDELDSGTCMAPIKRATALWLVTTFLVAVLFVAFHVAREGSRRARRRMFPCITQLRQIDSAKNQWAIEQMLSGAIPTNEIVFASPQWNDLAPFIHYGGLESIYCHADPTRSYSNSYELGPITNNPRCRIVPDKHVL